MHMLYVQLLDSSKASKTLAFAILARGLSFESGKLTRIIHIAWYGSADPANTVQEAVATSRDAKFLWQTLKAPDDDRVTVTCVANPIQVWPLNSCGTACSTWKLLKGVHFQIFFHQSLEHVLVEDASFTTVTWQHGAGLHSNQDESSPVPCHTLHTPCRILPQGEKLTLSGDTEAAKAGLSKARFVECSKSQLLICYKQWCSEHMTTKYNLMQLMHTVKCIPMWYVRF